MNRELLASSNSPLKLIAAKQKIERSDADEIALRVLIALDAAKRSRGCPSLANFLTKHLIMAIAIGSQMRNQTFSNLAMNAYEALYKASMRNTIDLDLTTKEYESIKRAIALYVNHLPNVSRGMFDFAALHAQKTLSRQ